MYKLVLPYTLDNTLSDHQEQAKFEITHLKPRVEKNNQILL